MRACSYPAGLGGSVHAAVTRRFAAALFISTSAHVLLTSSLTPGATGRSHAAPLPMSAPISVRLVTPEAPTPVAEAAPLREPPRPRRVREDVTPLLAAVSPVAAAAPSKGGTAHIPDPIYYAARQLDVYPVLTGTLDLRASAADEVKGRVLLLVLIDAAGAVDDVSVVESAAPQWDDAARRALATARFKPALRGGRPVRSRLLVEIDYDAPRPAP